MSATWPAELPQLVLQSGFGETFGDGALRSSMDTGPAKSRPRFTAAPRPVTARQTLTDSQAEILDAFYHTTLAMGALSFGWVHPRTQAVATLRFTAPPRLQPAGGLYWTADYALEVLP